MAKEKEGNTTDIVYVQSLIERGLRHKFKAKCKSDNTTPSQWIRAKIEKYVEGEE